MTDYHLGAFRSIKAFVEDKIRWFSEHGHTFETMFALMFREEENVLYERSEGYRIRKTTYGEAKAHVLRKRAVLKERLAGLAPDTVVGLHMDNSLEWIETFWAILAAGYRPLLMNLRLPEALLAEAMQACGCAAVISDGKRFDCLTLLPEDLAGWTEDEGGDAAENAAAAPAAVGPFGTELLVMSSGTSEHVKVCAYTAEEFFYQIVDSYRIIRDCPQMKKHYDGELKLLAFLPFYHVFGLIAVYLWFGFFARTFVHLNDLAPQTIVNTIKRHKVTHVFAVPLFWEKVYEQALRGIRERGEATWNKFERALALQQKLPEPAARAFSAAAFREVRDKIFGQSICFMITGGSYIDPEILTFFNGIGYRLANGYGMTEIGITSVELSDKRRWLCSGSVGKPVGHAEYRVDENGELLVRGEVLARYVLCGGERTDRDGWFRTQDLASCTDGHYFLQGRRDDLIIGPEGENLNPNLIEPQLRTDGCAVCLIGARQNGKTVPVLLASVGPYLTGEQLRTAESALRDKIAQAGLSGTVGKIALLGEPLLTETEFKPNRIRLAADYAAGRLTVLEPASRQDEAVLGELALRVRTCMAEALGRPAEEISAEADFFTELGGSSIDYFGMLAKLEEEFTLPFPPENLQLRTVSQIAGYIRQNFDGAR